MTRACLERDVLYGQEPLPRESADQQSRDRARREAFRSSSGHLDEMDDWKAQLNGRGDR